MYDIIGDIHGHADELVELLEKLGYTETGGRFCHPSRMAVFCGDFVDRGPQIPDVVQIAKSMVEHDSALAVMGNHEFNALAYSTRHPDKPDKFLRPHNTKNVSQHKATWEQFQPARLNEALDWFATLPTSLELDGLRIVHACWNDAANQTIANALPADGKMDAEFLRNATDPTHEVFRAIECILKGPELPLPKGVTVTDKEGNIRKRIRIRWFEPAANQTWASYSLPRKPELAADPVPEDSPAVPYSSEAPPLFVGHFWLSDSTPEPLTPNIACLDFSVAKNGLMCAYRFDGESVLTKDKFVTVPSRDRGAVE